MKSPCFGVIAIELALWSVYKQSSTAIGFHYKLTVRSFILVVPQKLKTLDVA